MAEVKLPRTRTSPFLGVQSTFSMIFTVFSDLLDEDPQYVLASREALVLQIFTQKKEELSGLFSHSLL